MKLNNNGWGLRVAIAYMSIFIFCLILAVIGINRMGFFSTEPVITGEEEKTNVPEGIDEKQYYEDLETSVYEAIQKYSNDFPDLLEDKNSIIININELIDKGYITSLEDADGKQCKGYVEVFQSNTINYSVYIKCSDYQTVGYDTRKEL